MIDAWIYMDKTALAFAWAQAHPPEGGDPVPANVAILSQGIRGYWKDVGTDEVVNVLATKEQLDQFQIDHGANVSAIYGWVQGPGYDNLDDFETIPTEVLASMRDHVVVDRDGTELSREAASLTNPNWGHMFFGQSERIFAGGFTKGFNGGFK